MIYVSHVYHRIGIIVEVLNDAFWLCTFAISRCTATEVLLDHIRESRISPTCTIVEILWTRPRYALL